MTRPPILNRLVLVGFVVVTAIIGATGLIIAMQREATIDAFQTATMNLGAGMAQQTTQSITSVDRVLTDIQTVLTADPSATTEHINAAMRLRSTFDLLVDRRKPLALFGVALVDALLLIDADGRTANTSRGFPSAALDVSGRDVFSHFGTDDDATAFVGTPAKDPTTGHWTAFLARRVNDAHGRFAGLVVAELSLSGLQAFYSFAMPAHRSVYLVRQDGVILVRFPPRDNEIGKKIPDQSPWYAAVAQAGGTYRAAGYFDRTPVIAAVRPLRNLPVVVEASVTEADTLSEWHQQRLWVVVAGVSAVVCVILLLRLFAAQYQRVAASEQSLAAKNAELDTAHRQLDATLSNLSHGVCFFNENKELIVYNRLYYELYDLPAEAIRPGMSLADIAELRIAAGSSAHRTVAEYLAFSDALVRDGTPQDTTIVLRNGRTLAIRAQPMPGRGWVSTHEDITERRAAEVKVAFLARHDVLTGLANRVLFHDRLEQALAMTERGKGFAVLCLDLDRFKAVNDTLGHPIGDALLCAVANRLRSAVRETDTVARLGGDEFAILQLSVSDAAETTVVARRIVEAINEVFELDGHKVNIGTSIGIAMAPGDSTDPGQLMKCADLALYRSKQEGRGTWRFFEPAMDALARERRALEADLRLALRLGQLELHYQPMVCSRQRTVTGFEALLRWHHPTRGTVAPADFISVAEEIGLIAEIGAWVLHQACAAAAAWPDHLRVAVNLSTRQFRGQTLVSTVADAMRTSGLSPRRLELEITESLALQTDQATLATLHDLQALGPRIALDDFGTGYSSLSYLRSFPFDTIKVDRCFVGDLQTSDKSVSIIRGIIGLAANLHMKVVAEGVETEEQFEFLSSAGCTEIQGYLFSRPVPGRDVPGLIECLSGANTSAREVFGAAAA
jgi:diguanylate cyclase (GGDEF)-like protein